MQKLAMSPIEMLENFEHLANGAVVTGPRPARDLEGYASSAFSWFQVPYGTALHQLRYHNAITSWASYVP